ncbi:pentatricopeptide repeat-containing protein mitochondrial [Dorcoceras hygrometricum]|uniref:Pentatricopeptide repeat-containing protein mitochondrial n=1 Tax=Dorcoceras hygrometricum TaxID=472368 RepID=A0A2Z7CS06_9LAMI|nr:pentatricopeptide repeat-containing protein mitochondrial [Dorcoceras hygrometricum]
MIIRQRCYKELQQCTQFSRKSGDYFIIPCLKFGFASLAALEQHPRSSNKWMSSSLQESESHAYARMLQHCIKNEQPTTGKFLHCEILKRGVCLDLFASNVLLNFYVKNGFLDDGVRLFDEMRNRNMVSFVTLIQGYTSIEEYAKAVELFVRLHKEGHELNTFVFTSVLKLVVSMESPEFGWCIHACVHKLGHDADAFVGTGLIDAYSICGLVGTAKEVFNGILNRDMVSWTGMVACYAENNCFEDALDLFNQMRMDGLQPNNFTFASVIKACLGLEADCVGKSIHGCILKTCYEIDQYVGVSLLDLYAGSGNIEDAQQVFCEIPKDSVVPWSFMISRHSQCDRCEEALALFLQMRNAFIFPNQFTLASVLQACATNGSLGFGKQIHCLVIKNGLNTNVFVSNALMDVYAKCGDMEASMNLFSVFTDKNEVSWNTMIVGCVQLGDGEKAFQMFMNMCEEHVVATEVTYSSLLRACSSLAALVAGTQIHSVAIKTLYDWDGSVSNALIDMYAKCGRIKESRLIFDIMSQRDIVSWNSMISSYSMHGLGAEALKVYKYMLESGFTPNQLTFVGVLSACSNTGLLDQGQNYFTSMQEDHGIEPCMEHYTCMVSLLGRLGHFEKAVKMIDEIPSAPSVMVWRALLGACVAHKNVELGKFAADRVLEMDPQDESSYVLLSNIYATEKRWDHVALVRKNMKKKRIKKEPGLSWIESQGMVHYFAVGDDSHEDIKLIRGMLEWLNVRSTRGGYAPDHGVILLDVEEDEKGRLLWLHSERIALAFALTRMPPGTPIRIIKNLRICADCHAAFKFISSFIHREVIIRDVNRYHHFQDGICSCNDYW